MRSCHAMHTLHARHLPIASSIPANSPSIENILKQFILLNKMDVLSHNIPSSPSFGRRSTPCKILSLHFILFLGFSVGICTQFWWFGKWLFAYFLFKPIYEFILIKITLLASLVSIQMATKWAHFECYILLFDSFSFLMLCAWVVWDSKSFCSLSLISLLKFLTK